MFTSFAIPVNISALDPKESTKQTHNTPIRHVHPKSYSHIHHPTSPFPILIIAYSQSSSSSLSSATTFFFPSPTLGVLVVVPETTS